MESWTSEGNTSMSNMQYKYWKLYISSSMLHENCFIDRKKMVVLVLNSALHSIDTNWKLVYPANVRCSQSSCLKFHQNTIKLLFLSSSCDRIVKTIHLWLITCGMWSPEHFFLGLLCQRPAITKFWVRQKTIIGTRTLGLLDGALWVGNCENWTIRFFLVLSASEYPCGEFAATYLKY